MGTRRELIRFAIFAWAALLGLGWLALAGQARADSPATGVPWPATDALGRKLPTVGEAPSPRPDRFVGIFYFLWHENRSACAGRAGWPVRRLEDPRPGPGCAEAPRLAALGPDRHCTTTGASRSTAITSPTTPGCSAATPSSWPTPGVDTLIFDTTNAVTYPDVYTALCEVFRAGPQGGRADAADRLHGQHRGRQDRPRALRRPLQARALPRALVPLAGQAAADLRPEGGRTPSSEQFFTLRRAHWPFTMVNTPQRLALGGDLSAALRLHRRSRASPSR